jgi:hypothetical protein
VEKELIINIYQQRSYVNIQTDKGKYCLMLMYLSTASTRRYISILKIGIEFHKLWLSLARNVDLILLLKKHWKINYWKLWHLYQKTHNYDYDIAHYFTFTLKINKYIIIFSFLLRYFYVFFQRVTIIHRGEYFLNSVYFASSFIHKFIIKIVQADIQ